MAENWLPKAIGKEIDLGFELNPADILGNELLLQELLANLLDNALRHAPRGGVVTVGCGQEGRTAWLCVEDNGPEYRKGTRTYGQRFYRPAGQTGDGCGLGLAIVREIARQYQGTLSVGTSPRLGGALLKVSFPLAVSEH